ncbi:unnamed protein product [Prunus armeniaca]|uniref:FAR1 domain-containing protein n=1 Tax=Prunus armeniaca TaxID=36596 RepID=A0A6J5V1C6_PRUAR|nr:unnamed protein product [Prunus armeniaca]CAB4311605.1 unnamed protein product [Prunus armeniaca]
MGTRISANESEDTSHINNNSPIDQGMEESSARLENNQHDDAVEMNFNGIEKENNGDETENNDTVMSVEEKVQDPQVGMIFDSIDEVITYYKQYGRQSGFPVIKRSSTNGDDGNLKYVTISCAREGKSKSKSSNFLKPRPSIKNDCKAQLRAGLLNGKWKVNSVRLDHNHGLSPTKTRHWKCFREISSNIKKKLEVNDKAGIRLNKSYNSMVVEVGGHENMKCLEKDCRNYIEKVRGLRLGEGDATAILKCKE